MSLTGLYEYEIKNGEEKGIDDFVSDVIKRADNTGYSIDKRDYETTISNTVEGNKPGELFLCIEKKNKKIRLGIPDSGASGARWCLTNLIESEVKNNEKIKLLKKYGNIELERIQEEYKLEL